MQSIRMLREKKKLSQKELADQFHVDQSTISKWENGHASPNPGMLEKIAAYFDVPIAVLFQRVEAPVDTYGESVYIPVYSSADDAVSPSQIGQDIAYMKVAMTQSEKDLYFAYCVDTDTYFPDFRKEDIIVIKRTDDYAHGDTVLVSLNYPAERPSLCRLRRVEKGLLFITCGHQEEPVLVSEDSVSFYFAPPITTLTDSARSGQTETSRILSKQSQPEQDQDRKVCLFGKAVELRRYLCKSDNR